MIVEAAVAGLSAGVGFVLAGRALVGVWRLRRRWRHWKVRREERRRQEAADRQRRWQRAWRAEHKAVSEARRLAAEAARREMRRQIDAGERPGIPSLSVMQARYGLGG